VHLRVAHGIARLDYVASDGTPKHVLAWGAIDARTPSTTIPQVELTYDRHGGGEYAKFGHDRSYYKRITTCRPYTGPRGPNLPDVVGACDDDDGSHWVVQSWVHLLPDGGRAVRPGDPKYWGMKELHLAHWSDAFPLPEFNLGVNWKTPGPVDRIFGQLTYRGTGVHGFTSNSRGDPGSDRYGRNVFVDVHEPTWKAAGFDQGGGWYRFTGAILHNPRDWRLPDGSQALGGNFCMAMWAHADWGRTTNSNSTVRPPSEDYSYRLTVIGPGVLPVQRWYVRAAGDFDAAANLAAKTKEREYTPVQDTWCY